MKVVITPKWFNFVEKLTGSKYIGMSLLWFILIPHAKYNTPELINHESIHWEQQKETLIIGFYVLYLLFYLFNLIRYMNHDKAYTMIPFEREAHYFENHSLYLHNRKRYQWLFNRD